MSTAPQDSRLARLEKLARTHAGKALLLLLGFGLGAIVFSSSSAPPPAEHAEHDSAAEPSANTIWTCSMHPQIQRTEPGACPICGMDLIPVRSSVASGSEPAGDRVVLSERARALAQLRTSTVRRQADASADLRLLGRFRPNETTLRKVTAWIGGRIEDLRVNVTGERVRAGQVIATLYSPEVFAAHQDLLVAKQQVDRLQESPAPSRQAAQAALEAARQRLRLLGVPDDELARMEGQTQPTRSIAIRTPFSGTVIERIATEGAYVSTGTPLYQIADLRSLWLQLDAYESDLARLKKGQPVQVVVSALPGEVFEGQVTFIDPTLDPQRRTVQVRVQVDNQDGRLRPGMFAEATVFSKESAIESTPLVVPASAPLFTGRRAIVYVEVKSPDGVGYEPRTVRLGPRLGEVYPVIAGLSEGERVVTKGAFALDADLQIRGGPSMMTAPDDLEPSSVAQAITLPSSQRAQLAPVVRAYLAVQVALADDDLAKAKEAAQDLSQLVQTVHLDKPAEAQSAWNPISGALEAHGQHIAMAKSLEGAREGFEPLSEAMVRLLQQLGNPLEDSLSLAFCPMASGSDGAIWVQKGSKIDNAYFGASMSSCGEVRQEVRPNTFLETTEPQSSRPKPAPRAPGGHQH